MKKLVYNIHFWGLLLMAGLAFTACSNDSDEIENNPAEPVTNNVLPNTAVTYTMSIEASKGEEAGSRDTRALSPNGTTVSSTWTKDDQVDVYKGSEKVGTLQAQSSGASTTLSGTLTTSELQIDDELTLKYLSPSYTTQNGTLTGNSNSIDNTCDYSTATVTVTKIENSKVTVNGAADFVNQQAIVKFTVKNNAGTAVNASKLVITVEGNTYTITPSAATSELYVALPEMSDKTMRLVATVSDATYVYMKSGVTFEKGKYYTRGVKMKTITYPIDLSALTTSQTEYIGSIIGSNGKIYPNVAAATDASITPCAAIVYVGAVSKYFDNCIAVALTDSKYGDAQPISSQTYSAVGSYALSHSITVGSTTYSTCAIGAYYDRVKINTSTSSATRTGDPDLVKGWRIPSVTDWRYLMAGLVGTDATDPKGIDEDDTFGTSALLPIINTICGNNSLENNGYWTSSDVDDEDAEDEAWIYSLSQFVFLQYGHSTPMHLRAFFAY